MNPGVAMVKLSYNLGNAATVEELDGLMIIGGGDINPSRYGKADQLSRCDDIDDRRDEFESDVIKRALNARLPILAICRGMQMMNVHLGGSLIIDLRAAGYNDHSAYEKDDRYHKASSIEGSLFREITGQAELTVNSSHHQGVERLGKGLIAGAISPDNVIEAAEWADKQSSPFLLMVQYHPERMNDPNNPASRNVAERFLKEAAQSINNTAAIHTI